MKTTCCGLLLSEIDNSRLIIAGKGLGLPASMPIIGSNTNNIVRVVLRG
jgi:hypothetical protein